jgi:hypothetical protein
MFGKPFHSSGTKITTVPNRLQESTHRPVGNHGQAVTTATALLVLDRFLTATWPGPPPEQPEGSMGDSVRRCGMQANSKVPSETVL